MTTTILGRCRAPRTLSSLGRMHSIHYNYTTRRCMLEMSAIECVFMICKFAKTFAKTYPRNGGHAPSVGFRSICPQCGQPRELLTMCAVDAMGGLEIMQ